MVDALFFRIIRKFKFLSWNPPTDRHQSLEYTLRIIEQLIILLGLVMEPRLVQ